ncbi:hypothetical protein A0J57_09920 [Sphingobium sp. 22B]|uniref:Membrane protein n=1 Tax=Sphingobium fuliginis (strain ATCC 27551) TaxID=336203 RepID=A0A292ZC17_SPHSA|nr:EamA family transporter RarD [Sphingobium sp. YBL2]KXU32525.1 hypothetical protein AXW74_07220 [Sphingobium sp. AM]KYC32582.1 hypothetical protein A0J57_09920 [Sphingobium sp. 22B]OAP32909.1 hypothetical protein A8O16_06155 [Sphingobium sp. 20006FA]PNQ04733.1 hypothetical protein A8G00_00745 [Sphingobium sp. SA916]GAY21007.1 protein rarD [Sphingobium fuliginis]
MAAYCAWGLLPIYFKLLHHVNAVEIVSQRVLWSLLLILALLLMRRNLVELVTILRDRRLLSALAASAVLIGMNWLTYVWAVNAGHVLAASLGYFLNPLVTVGLGVLLLHERLRRGQLAAVGIAAVGVAIMAATALTTLWISVALALTFAFYALIRKLTPVAPMVGLGVETLLLMPPAMAYLFWLSGHGGVGFGQDMPTTILLIAAGAVTTAPLLLFATAAHRLPMATLGLLQYLAPSLQFLCGILLFGEKLTAGQMASFALIWLSLILFAADGLTAARRNRLATV